MAVLHPDAQELKSVYKCTYNTQQADAEGEERFISLALSPVAVVLVTVYTYVGENIRLISSRKASPGESRAYEAR